MRSKSKILSFIVVFLLSLMILIFITGCGNRQLIDTTYTFDQAIISLPNGGVVEGEVQSQKDFEDGDQIQVKIDGDAYLVHSSNIVLIQKGK